MHEPTNHIFKQITSENNQFLNKVLSIEHATQKKRRPLEIMPAESVNVVLKHTEVSFCWENTTSVKTLKTDKKSMI